MKTVAGTTLLLAALLLSGCASTEIVSSISIPKSSSTGQINVCRKRVFVGDGVATIIYIDGNAILRSGPGVCFSASLETGNHTIGVLGRSWAGPDTGKKSFNLNSGERLYFIVENETIKEVKSKYIKNLLKSNYKLINVQKIHNKID